MPSTKFRHNDYKPFLRYIERQSSIDPEKFERTKSKYGSIGSNNIDPNSVSSGGENIAKKKSASTNRLIGDGDNVGNNFLKNGINNNNKENNKMAVNVATTATNVQKDFREQREKAAMDRARKDDERHAELHAKSKVKKFSEGDKIFLLKREIDNLRGKIVDQGGSLASASTYRNNDKFSSGFAGSASSGGTSGGAAAAATTTTTGAGVLGGFVRSDKIPLLTVTILIGLLVLTARFLNRKLKRIRAEGSLLMMGDAAAAALTNDDDYDHDNHHQDEHGHHHRVFELQRVRTSSSIRADEDRRQQQQEDPSSAAAVAYAPPSASSSSEKADIRLV